jgi:predicted site-specific integrase-resolvase
VNDYSIEAAADLMGVSPRIAERWHRSGRLRGRTDPATGEVRVAREELVRFLREHGMGEIARGEDA